MIQEYHQIVMSQVRKNMLYELLRKANDNDRYRHELYEFIAKEPLVIDNEVVDWMLNFGHLSLGVGKAYRPIIDSSKVIRPSTLPGWRATSLFSYLKQWSIYLTTKVFCNILRRILVFQPENQVFLVHRGEEGRGQQTGGQ